MFLRRLDDQRGRVSATRRRTRSEKTGGRGGEGTIEFPNKRFSFTGEDPGRLEKQRGLLTVWKPRNGLFLETLGETKGWKKKVETGVKNRLVKENGSRAGDGSYMVTLNREKGLGNFHEERKLRRKCLLKVWRILKGRGFVCEG